MQVGRDTWIEDLIEHIPVSVSYLIDRGMKPLACGEPVWLTVEELARSKGLSDGEVDQLVSDLSVMSRETESTQE